MTIAVCITIIALILVIWFRTDAWLEYTRLFRLNFLSFYKDFDAKYKEDVSLQYLPYLRRYHNCFFVRLITCPTCIAVWLGIICAAVTSLVMFPIYAVGGLVLFLITDRLLG